MSGAFRLNGGQWTTLDLLRQDMLAELTQLRLDECSADRDWLFLMGLTALKILELPVSAFSERDRVTAQLVPSMFPAILRIRLRSAAQSVLTEEFKRIFELDSARRPLAYIHNQYERQDDVVLDRATGLIWQQSGSSRLSYAQAVDYVEGLNAANWGGFADWRLPTVPELLSLLGPKRSLSGLYIASIFEARQVWCWSADRVAASSGSAWRVDFALGGVRWSGFRSYGYVRCVRS
ncbi:hypothetical protein CSB45_12975 [candidate division KSB3 bacterium]|uniref:Lcl C-terminal domain-containing protein n=1 Tax=candidate division KSB3 bacterium TaxID=2044937 RepID=A0A2G6E1T7_9BACT|nr:MAG: hypothetical protein CSB45_12975 [candidate division KSB3 bacterium]